MTVSLDSFRCRRPLPNFDNTWFFSLPEAEAAGAGPISRLPYSLRILTENLLRNETGTRITKEDIRFIGHSASNSAAHQRSIAFHPGRILMQDSSGLPVLADIAALAEAVEAHSSRAALQIGLHLSSTVGSEAWNSRDLKSRPH